VLAIDDIAQHPFPVDVLLNQNVDAERLAYEVLPETTMLLGPGYALLGARYRAARPAAPPLRERAQRVLVSFGGTDAAGAMGLVLEALERLAGRRLDVDVVAGAASPHARKLAAQADASRHEVRVQQDLADLVDVMRSADVFIGAGGSTTWEACCLGLPLALLPIADNQLGLVAELERREIALNLGRATNADPAVLAERLGDWLDDDAGTLAAQAERAWRLVDGRGAERVVEQLLGPEPDVGDRSNRG
jgi:spore coat polysaccharide biosynthesis predicted glycosyltransferase SpsG